LRGYSKPPSGNWLEILFARGNEGIARNGAGP
jgi:hypothetical protein